MYQLVLLPFSNLSSYRNSKKSDLTSFCTVCVCWFSCVYFISFFILSQTNDGVYLASVICWILLKFAAIYFILHFFIESCLKRPRTMKDFFQSDFERFISKIFSSSVARIEMVLKTCTSFTVISIFLRLIVLQTMSPTEYIDSPTVRVDIPTSLFSFFFFPTNRWS